MTIEQIKEQGALKALHSAADIASAQINNHLYHLIASGAIDFDYENLEPVMPRIMEELDKIREYIEASRKMIGYVPAAPSPIYGEVVKK